MSPVGRCRASKPSKAKGRGKCDRKEFASPFFHLFFQKFSIVRPCWLPRLRVCRVIVPDGRYEKNCVQFKTWCENKEPALWRIGAEAPGDREPCSNKTLRCHWVHVKGAARVAPFDIHVIMAVWKYCAVLTQAVAATSTIDTTFLRWLWSLEESGSQTSPRGGAESDFEALSQKTVTRWSGYSRQW